MAWDFTAEAARGSGERYTRDMLAIRGLTTIAAGAAGRMHDDIAAVPGGG